jgi:hypothetical protein
MAAIALYGQTIDVCDLKTGRRFASVRAILDRETFLAVFLNERFVVFRICDLTSTASDFAGLLMTVFEEVLQEGGLKEKLAIYVYYNPNRPGKKEAVLAIAVDKVSPTLIKEALRKGVNSTKTELIEAIGIASYEILKMQPPSVIREGEDDEAEDLSGDEVYESLEALSMTRLSPAKAAAPLSSAKPQETSAKKVETSQSEETDLLVQVVSQQQQIEVLQEHIKKLEAQRPAAAPVATANPGPAVSTPSNGSAKKQKRDEKVLSDEEELEELEYDLNQPAKN